MDENSFSRSRFDWTGELGPPVAVYGGALLIGLCLVSFPASSAYLKSITGISNQEYGSIFLPQMVLAVAGALGAGAIVKKCSLKVMYMLALLSFSASQVFLSGVWAIRDPESAMMMLMAGTACFGFGFGFGGGPLNGLAYMLYPNRAGSALSALHMMAGLGMTLGPMIFALAIARHCWIFAPYGVLAIAVLLLVLTTVTRLPSHGRNLDAPTEAPTLSGCFWVMVIIAAVYAFSEGTFSNWTVIYLSDDKLFSARAAALALGAFWAGVTAGRMLVSIIVVRFNPAAVWQFLPPLIVIAFMSMPEIANPAGAILALGFAGLACSAFFPMMVTVAAGPFPSSVSFIASMLTASLMVGVGCASWLVGFLRTWLSMEQIYVVFAVFPLLTSILIKAGTKMAGDRIPARQVVEAT